MGRARRSTGAQFTPINEATFDLVSDEASFEVVGFPETPTEEEQEQTVQQMLEEQGIASAEAAFLSGEIKYVISSNVHALQYLWRNPDNSLLEHLLVTFKDGSIYLYEGVPLEVASSLYHASSYGKAVWNLLRVRGTVFGTQYPYRLVSGNRVWYNAGADSQARHAAIPKSGEPSMDNAAPYHPSLNWKGAPGAMGKKGGGVNLNRKGGSKKVAFFTPAQAKTGHVKPSGPFA